ncbi:hypothetical protein F356_061 [Campylobacter phage F356]|uniref:Uncharacterized protein n=2 Tax=Fletchervirus CPX TaxID=1110702 RepID=A0A7T3KEF7_9CAUD|nr:hypothetical protein F355_135 [Campylobacter phage F355]QPX63699.1 hypothetical protein F356_061 [Campylobacter phage F356]
MIVCNYNVVPIIISLYKNNFNTQEVKICGYNQLNEYIKDDSNKFEIIGFNTDSINLPKNIVNLEINFENIPKYLQNPLKSYYEWDKNNQRDFLFGYYLDLYFKKNKLPALVDLLKNNTEENNIYNIVKNNFVSMEYSLQQNIIKEKIINDIYIMKGNYNSFVYKMVTSQYKTYILDDDLGKLIIFSGDLKIIYDRISHLKIDIIKTENCIILNDIDNKQQIVKLMLGL